MNKILTLVFFLNISSYTQQLTNPQWVNYTHSEIVYSIAEEGNFLWLGTYGGLVKLDRTTLQKTFYNKGNSYLPSNHIISIAIDDNGYKWICTYNGLVKFKDDNWTIYNHTNSGIPNSRLTSIIIDPLGIKWIGTYDSGLVSFNDSEWNIYNNQNSSLGSNFIKTLYSNDNTTWIGTLNGLYRIDDSLFTYIASVGNRIITCIDMDVNNNLWIGSRNGLLKLLSNNMVTQFTSEIITSLYIDSSNIKWFGTKVTYFPYQAGMRNIDSAETQVTINNFINSSTNYPWFHSIFFDQDGTKWFGSENGLVRAQTDVQFINVSNSLLGRNYVTKMYIDGNDNKWFYAWGSIPLSVPVLPPGYLTSFSNGVWQNFNESNSPVTIGGVTAVSEFNSNATLVAAYDIGGGTTLRKYSGNSWTQISVPQTQYNEIYYMWFDEYTGRLYLDFIGANWENNLFYSYDLQFWIPVPAYPVYDINQMKRLNNIVWIASPEGLLKYNGTTFTHYNTTNSGLPHNNVRALDFDSFGNIWAATQGGLVKYDGLDWTVYDRYNSPLSCDNLTGVVIDSSNNIFISTTRIYWVNPHIQATGLVKFDGVNWTIFNSQNSGKPDHIPGNEDINCLAIDASGKIWMATESGVGVYDKDGIPVPVELTSFSAIVNNNTVSLNWQTATELNNRGFEIEKQKENNDWQKIGFVDGNGTTTEAQSYSFVDKNLSAGKYQYRLKQIDFDGTYEYSNEIEVEIGIPEKFELFQNYPNPFNPSTTIKFALPKSANVKLDVYSISGEYITTLVKDYMPAGNHSIQFVAEGLSSGVYIYKLVAGENSFSKKMVLLK